LHLSTWDPFLKIVVALILIAGTGGFSGSMIKNGIDNISKKETTIKHLEAFSLEIFRKFAEYSHGIFFNINIYSPQEPEAIRHLINLDLIELNAFPSEKNTRVYSFTKLGRYVLEKKLKRKLLSEDFCEMMRIRYWEAYEKEFRKEKKNFAIKYKMSWDDAFRLFEPIMIKLKDPSQTEAIGAFSIFLQYIEKGKPYDEINKNLVIPWQKEVEKIKNPLHYIF
jgi:hypothetical protein